MNESPDGDDQPEATDADVEAAIDDVVDGDGSDDGPVSAVTDVGGPTQAAGADEPGLEDLPDEMLDTPTSAEDGDHTLLEEHERQTESALKSYARLGAFWGGATVVAVAVTLTAIVSLRQAGLSDGPAFVLASVGMAVIVGLVFLSLRR
ncbi:MAG: hypothetical protein ABEJ05_05085 [Haloglomus sp.]